MRWIRVRPGWLNRPPALDRLCLNRGERSGEGGGDGLLCPLLGSRLYGCIGISAALSLFLPLSMYYVMWPSLSVFFFFSFLFLCVCLCFL